MFLSALIDLKCHLEQANPSEWFFTSFYLKSATDLKTSLAPRFYFAVNLLRYTVSETVEDLTTEKAATELIHLSPGQCPLRPYGDTVDSQ